MCVSHLEALDWAFVQLRQVLTATKHGQAGARVLQRSNIPARKASLHAAPRSHESLVLQSCPRHAWNTGSQGDGVRGSSLGGWVGKLRPWVPPVSLFLESHFLGTKLTQRLCSELELWISCHFCDSVWD